LKPDQGVLGEQLKALELIKRGLHGDVPFLMTVFNPISIAAKLAPSKGIFARHLREHADKVTCALDVITETFIGFSQACVERGADGLFLATTDWASSDWMTGEEYVRWARPYDLKILNSIPTTEFSILHVCGSHNLLRFLGDYPVKAFNWDARASGNLSLAQGQALLKGKIVIGGMAQGKGLVSSTPEQLTGEVTGLRVAMGNKGWMLAPGCTFMPETPEANIAAIRQAVGKESFNTRPQGREVYLNGTMP
jgi:uroporphyrinogen decarboxylase